MSRLPPPRVADAVSGVRTTLQALARVMVPSEIVLLELTAMDPEGLEFAADDYAVDRLGGLRAPVAWASPAEASMAQGERLQAELIFEVPDKALELTLEGAGGVRLSMGADHHSGGG